MSLLDKLSNDTDLLQRISERIISALQKMQTVKDDQVKLAHWFIDKVMKYPFFMLFTCSSLLYTFGNP